MRNHAKGLFISRDVFFIAFLISSSILAISCPVLAENHLDTLRRHFATLRVGQFMHYGMNTFNGTGDDIKNESITMYNPKQINPAQWVSAGKTRRDTVHGSGLQASGRFLQLADHDNHL